MELRGWNQRKVFDLYELAYHGLEGEPEGHQGIALADFNDLVKDLLSNVLEVLISLVDIDKLGGDFLLLCELLLRSGRVEDLGQLFNR